MTPPSTSFPVRRHLPLCASQGPSSISHTLCSFPLSFLREARFSWVEFKKGLIQLDGSAALPKGPDLLDF